MKPSDLVAWKSERVNSYRRQTTRPLPVEDVSGAIRVAADTVMIAKEFLEVCFGDYFEGPVKHPDFGDAYIVSTQNF